MFRELFGKIEFFIVHFIVIVIQIPRNASCVIADRLSVKIMLQNINIVLTIMKVVLD